MRGRSFGAAAALAALAVIATLVFLHARGRRDAAPAPAPVAESVPRERPRPAPRAELSPAAGRAGREDALGLPASAVRARVLVVDGRSGAPLPGAIVHWLDVNDPGVLLAMAASGEGPSRDLVETAGVRVVADEHGIASLPLATPFVVRARHGRLWNEVVLPQMGAGPLRLELFPDLLVDVADEAGTTLAGVPLELRQVDGDGPVHEGVTGPDGRAVFSHAHVRRGSPADLELSFALPLAERVALALRSHELPEEPQRMRLPPAGRVVVELVDLEGRPHAGEARVTLLAKGERADGALRTRVLRAGRAEFAYVGLGLELSCSALVDPTAEVPALGRYQTLARGPRAAGETTRIVLGPGVEGPVLVGRVLGPDGRPLANAQGWVRLQGTVEDLLVFPPELSFDRGLELHTNARGRFQIPLPPGPVPAGERALVFAFPRAGARLVAADVGPEEKALVGLSAALASGTVELGDVELGVAPLLAAGRVVDSTGRPVEGATVWLATPDGKLSNGEETWADADEPLPVDTDADGRFELRGWLAGPFGIQAGRDGFHAPDCRRIAAGARDLVVRLEADAVIAGELLLDPGLPERCATVTLYRFDGRGAHPRVREARFPERRAARASFRWEDLEPGERVLEVELASDPRPVLSLALDLRPGAPADPRLAALDLRGLLRVVTLTVRDASGAPVARGWAQALDLAGEARPLRRFDGGVEVRDGVARLALARPVDVVVTAPGCSSVLLERVFDDRDVLLGAGRRVRLVLPASVTPPEPPVVLFAELQALDPRARAGRGAPRLAFDAQGRADGIAPGPGEYGITWVVEQPRPDGTLVAGASRRERSLVVRVDGAEGVQTIALEFDTAELSKALLSWAPKRR